MKLTPPISTKVPRSKGKLANDYIFKLQVKQSDSNPNSHLNSLSLQSDLHVLLISPLLMAPLQSRNKS